MDYFGKLRRNSGGALNFVAGVALAADVIAEQGLDFPPELGISGAFAVEGGRPGFALQIVDAEKDVHRLPVQLSGLHPN